MQRRDVRKRATWGSVLLATVAAGTAITPAEAIKLPLAPALDAVAGVTTFVHPDLAALAAGAPGRSVDAIVQLQPGVGADRVRGLLARLDVDVVREFPLVGGLQVRADAGVLKVLAATGLARAITPDGAVKGSGVDFDAEDLKTKFPVTVGASSTWGTLTGKGIGVAVIDSGIQGDHKDFKGADGRSRVTGSVVVNRGATSAKDTVGHGTHVAGIIAGDSTGRHDDDPLEESYEGIAPEANLVAIKIDDAAGEATVSDVIAGVQFAVQHRTTYNIRVLNLSLNSDVAQPYDVDPLDAAVEAAWLKGIVVVAAAGNRGTAADAVNYAPANDPFVITVGGTDEKGTSSMGDDALASWSSRGRTQDGFAKPEVTAPGAKIVGTLAAGSAFAKECPACVVDKEYLRIGGTSMATGVVSGVVANLLQAHPNWTPDQVKGALTNTAVGAVRGISQRAANAASGAKLTANTGLTANSSLDPATGEPKSSADWSRSSWSSAPGALSAGWSRSSWSCGDCTGKGSGSSADWSRSSWSRSSWSAAAER